MVVFLWHVRKLGAVKMSDMCETRSKADLFYLFNFPPKSTHNTSQLSFCDLSANTYLFRVCLVPRQPVTVSPVDVFEH